MRVRNPHELKLALRVAGRLSRSEIRVAWLDWAVENTILPTMAETLGNILDDPVAQILLAGEAATPSEAERKYLEDHLADVLRLVQSPLSDEEFRRHPLIVMLFSHGSRGWEDSLR